MRIAVSGAHSTGKSTLIDEFLRVHPDFVHEPEPYTVLTELGEEFSAEPCVDDFLRQLEFNLDRLKHHEAGARVIYERCPVDFAAYIECLPQTRRSGIDAMTPVTEAIKHLDLIVYLPIDTSIDTDEFPKLRKAVDRRLCEIYLEDDLGILVVEATGPTVKRLQTLEAAMNRF